MENVAKKNRERKRKRRSLSQEERSMVFVYSETSKLTARTTILFFALEPLIKVVKRGLKFILGSKKLGISTSWRLYVLSVTWMTCVTVLPRKRLMDYFPEILHISPMWQGRHSLFLLNASYPLTNGTWSMMEKEFCNFLAKYSFSAFIRDRINSIKLNVQTTKTVALF